MYFFNFANLFSKSLTIFYSTSYPFTIIIGKVMENCTKKPSVSQESGYRG